MIGAEVPAAAPSAVDVFASLRANWPLVTSVAAVVWYLGRLSRSVEAIGESVRAMAGALTRRLNAHSEKLDDHETRLSHTEAHVDTLRTAK